MFEFTPDSNIKSSFAGFNDVFDYKSMIQAHNKKRGNFSLKKAKKDFPEKINEIFCKEYIKINEQ